MSASPGRTQCLGVHRLSAFVGRLDPSQSIRRLECIDALDSECKGFSECIRVSVKVVEVGLADCLE